MHGTHIKIAKVYRLLRKFFSSLRALYLEEKNTLSSISRLPLEDFPENLYIALAKNALRIINVWLRSVQKKRALYLKSNMLCSSSLATIRGIFLKIHTAHFAHML
jgi:hypothetical protein